MRTTRKSAERIHDREEVISFLKVRPRHKDVEDRLIDMLASSGAILRGHFLLESDQHSRLFFRFADIASRFSNVDFIAEELISDLKCDHIDSDAILVQPSGGRVLAEMIKRKLDKKIIIARVNEKNQPTGKLVNEIDLHPNDKVLIVEDLATTGSSMKKMINSVCDRKAKPVAMILFATRNKEMMSKFEQKQGIPLYALADLSFESQTIAKSECELCTRSSPIPSWEV